MIKAREKKKWPQCVDGAKKFGRNNKEPAEIDLEVADFCSFCPDRNEEEDCKFQNKANPQSH